MTKKTLDKLHAAIDDHGHEVWTVGDSAGSRERLLGLVEAIERNAVKKGRREGRAGLRLGEDRK